MNLKKSEDSNQRRLESLRLQAEEFKLKKSQIRTGLHNLDSANGVPIKNKKIVFSDDDEDEPIKQELKIKKRHSNESSSKKQKLIDSEESDTEADHAKTRKMFENKINLNEKKANQLIQLKSKYSNEDSRFKIDERFVSGSSSSEASSSESESESEASGDEETEKAPRKPKKIISDESVKKKLKKETQASLDILASITGKTLRKPIDPNEDTSKRSEKAIQKMVRYDPTKTEHKVFELMSDNEEFDSEIGKLKDKQKNADQADKENQPDRVDMSQYTKIESNIKDLFQSKDVFQFKFDNIAEVVPNNSEWDKPTKLLENKFQKHFNFGHSKDSSSDEDSDDPDLPNYNKQTQKSKEILEAKPNGDSFKKRPHSETNSNIANKDFLPNFDEDKEIKDALSYFCCVKELDELRKDWSSNRVKLVEEYKKKHKRMLRIKKTKENEKVMTWRFKKK